jgi:hypothetical protein
MHTISGKPAFFSEPDGRIVFMQPSGRSNKLVTSLRQIKKEQKISLMHYKKEGMDFGSFDYGYYNVYLPK